MTPTLVLLADAASPASLQGIATLILVAAASLGVLAALAAYLVRGFWAKNVEPVVKAQFVAWTSAPEQVDARKAFVREIIDNETQRVDGIIRKEITTQVTNVQTSLLAAIKTLGQEVKDETKALRDSIEVLTQVDEEFRENVVSRLSKIEGAMGVLTKGKVGATADPR